MRAAQVSPLAVFLHTGGVQSDTAARFPIHNLYRSAGWRRGGRHLIVSGALLPCAGFRHPHRDAVRRQRHAGPALPPQADPQVLRRGAGAFRPGPAAEAHPVADPLSAAGPSACVPIRHGLPVRRQHPAQCRAPCGKPCVLKLDIRHFFGSILCSSVKGIAFPVEIYAEDLQILLAMLCYDRDRAGGQPGLERARRGPSEAAAGAAFLPEIRHFRLHGPGGHPGTGGPLSGLFAGPARRGARKSRPHRHINIPPERFYRDVPAVFIFRRGSDAEFSPARAGATAAGARRPAAGPAP